MTKIHSLLERQVKKFFGGFEHVPDAMRDFVESIAMKTFIESIDSTYRDFETDREMLERTLEVNSQEMLETNAEMRALLQALPDHLLTLDTDGTVLGLKTGRINDLFSHTEKIIGKPVYAMFRYQAKAPLQDAYDRMKITKASVSLEFSVVINGAVYVCEARFVPFLEDRSIVIIRNMTERNRTQMALLESELKLQHQNRKLVQTSNFLQSILDSSADVIIRADLYGNIVYSSPSIKNVTGHEQDELKGAKAYRLYGKGKRDTTQIMKELTKNKALRDYELTIKRKDGTLIDISGSFSLVTDEKDEVIGTLGIFRDISDRKKLEAHLMEVQKMESVGTLAGGIAHNFNNLLMGIQGYTSLMLDDLDAGHPHYEKLTHIEEQIKSGSNLTRQLLGFARNGKYAVRPADLNTIVKETAEMFGSVRKEISIHGRYAGNLCLVDVDRGQVEQVLLNLYVNAFQSMPEGGELYLETEVVALDASYAAQHDVTPGTYAKVSVTDTGSGMDKETMKRIFEPFFTTKEMGRGTGLGLASAYGIIKGHAGIITVHSEQGFGTTFTIYLPASTRDISPTKGDSENMLTGKETILLVDDETTIINVNREMLERLGYEVLTATSGNEAVETYKEHQNNINLVILDMIMPGMSGRETFDTLRMVEPGIKVILASGYSISGAALQIMDRGCQSFLQKPFRMELLSRTIRDVLDAG